MEGSYVAMQCGLYQEKAENKYETVEQQLTLQSFLTNTVPCPGYIVDEQK